MAVIGKMRIGGNNNDSERRIVKMKTGEISKAIEMCPHYQSI